MGSQPSYGTKRRGRAGPGEPPDSREESVAQRADRNLGELLQELRVAGLGVQVLFGFLLSLPFTNRFAKLSAGQRTCTWPAWCWPAVATALLVGPVAYHRLVFRRGQKERLVRAASVMAIGGLAAVALAVSAAVLLVTSYVGWRPGRGPDQCLRRGHVRPAVVRLPAHPPPLTRSHGSRAPAARPAYLQPGRHQRDLPRRAGPRDPGQQRPRRRLAHRVRRPVHAGRATALAAGRGASCRNRPATARPGTRIPAAAAADSAPTQDRSLAAKMAVGRSAAVSASSRRAARYPPSSVMSPVSTRTWPPSPAARIVSR